MLGDSFGDLVACQGHHAVGDDGAVSRDGHVRGSGPDVDEDEIQVAHGGRDEDIDGGDGL